MGNENSLREQGGKENSFPVIRSFNKELIST